MNSYALISLTSFTLCITFSAYVLFRNPKSQVHRLFAITCFFSACFDLITYGYLQSRSLEEAIWWWSVDVLWPFPNAVLLHFIIVFTGHGHWLNRKILSYALLYSPAVFFSLGELFFDLVTGMPVQQEVGWTYSYSNNSVAVVGTTIWLFAQYALSTILCIKRLVTSTDKTQRRQNARITSAMLVLVLSYIIQIVFFTDAPLALPIIQLSEIYFCATVAYSIYKYELFPLSTTTAAEIIVNTMSDALLLITPNGSIQSCNPSACSLLGYSTSRLIGTPVNRILNPDTDLQVNRLLNDKDANSIFPHHVETTFVSKHRKSIPVSLASAPITDERNNSIGHMLIARDITDQKRKELELRKHLDHLEQLVSRRTQELITANQQLGTFKSQLRLLAERVVNAKEEESSRISRELHDELGQILTGMKIELTLFERKLFKDPAIDEDEYTPPLTDIFDLTNTAIKAVKKIAKELRPRMLDDIGLVATVQWLITKYRRHNQTAYTLKTDVSDQIYEQAFSTAVFRIIQESLTNIARHANAQNVLISMYENMDVLEVTIQDDGQGIPLETSEGFQSVGILGMKERAHTFGGEVTVTSTPKEGTTVALTIPIKRKNE